MLNYDGGFEAVSFILVGASMKGLVPPLISKGLGILLEDVGGKDAVDNSGSEAVKLFFVGKDTLLQIFVFGLHQNVPGHVHRVLLWQISGNQVISFYRHTNVIWFISLRVPAMDFPLYFSFSSGFSSARRPLETPT